MPMCGSTPISFAIRIVCSQFLDLLDDNDDRLAKPAPHHGRADVSAVFVAVANDEALEILVHRERRDQLRFRAGFEAKMKFLAGVDDLFDHLPQLVHLDREDPAVVVAETEFVDRTLEGAVDRFNAMPQQILKTNHERKSEAARPRFLHDFENVDRSAALL